MRQKRKTAILLTLCMMTTAAGCGNRETQEFTSEGIELIEPVNTASNTEAAAYRNLYDYRIVSGYVYPYIQEYSFSVDVNLDEYTVMPGDTVKKGSLLITADENSLQGEIERLQKSMEDAADAYEEEQSGYEESIAEINEEIEELKEQIEDLEETRSKIANWNEDYNQTLLTAIARVEIQVEACELRIAQIRLKAQQATQLYELDADYNNRRLEQMRKQKDQYSLYSGMDGTVVSPCERFQGDWIRSGTPLVAVADETQRILRCEYLSKSEVERCRDIYAFINGERYEVTYQPYTKAEYDRLRAQNAAVYSSFVIDDPEGKVKIGDFAVLTEIYNRSEQVLSVAKNALHRDETGTYVYLMVDGESVLTRVRTGISDGVYTEIISGLSEKDVVLLTDNQPYASGTTTLERGSFSNSFSGSGYASYPLMDVIRNPVKHGTTYASLYYTTLGSYVKKGDLIATIVVDRDEMTLYEKQLYVQRLSERLAEIAADRDECQRKYDSEYDEAKKKALEKEIRALNKDIARRQRTIDERMEEIGELESDYSTTAIYADTEGLVVWNRNWNNDRSDTIAYEGAMAYVVKDENCFVEVQDERSQLVLGTTVDVEYKNSKNETCTVQGVVATASYAGLSQQLASDYAYIRFPREVAMQLPAFTYNGAGYLSGMTVFKVSALTREMNGVLIVPKSAVRDVGGKTYVYVLQEDGTVTAQSFIAGGYNASGYWVIEGLEEGMMICSES